MTFTGTGQSGNCGSLQENVEVPAVLLVDFGGVVFEGDRRDSEAFREVAAYLHGLLQRTVPAPVEEDRIIEDLRAGLAAYGTWKDQQSQIVHPREVSHANFWETYVVGDWPDSARCVVKAHATELCVELERRMQKRMPRPGIPELFRTAKEKGVRIGIISNALAGQASRDLLRTAGLDGQIGVQVYSDEVGVRKPNPEIFSIAARCFDVSLAACWYVGDKLDRDVVGGRRAGVGRVILLQSREGSAVTSSAYENADHVLTEAWGVRALLKSAAIPGSTDIL